MSHPHFYQQTEKGNRMARAYFDIHVGHVVQFWQDDKKVSSEVFLDRKNEAMRQFWRWLHREDERRLVVQPDGTAIYAGDGFPPYSDQTVDALIAMGVEP